MYYKYIVFLILILEIVLLLKHIVPIKLTLISYSLPNQQYKYLKKTKGSKRKNKYYICTLYNFKKYYSKFKFNKISSSNLSLQVFPKEKNLTKESYKESNKKREVRER